MPSRRRSWYVVLAVGIIAGLAALFQVGGSSGDPFDFPNEGRSIRSALRLGNPVKNIAGVIGLDPTIVCVSASGVDPRVVYAKSRLAVLRFDIKRPLSYYEGYIILLFANSTGFYIEKFDHTDVSFDELRSDQCRTVSKDFSIALSPPTNKYRYSDYSAHIEF